VLPRETHIRDAVQIRHMSDEDGSAPERAEDPPPILEDASPPGERVSETEAAAREAGHEGPFKRRPVYEIRDTSGRPADVPVSGIRCENCMRKGTEPADFEGTSCESLDPATLARIDGSSSGDG
jgi:hypothetical protein